MEKKLPPFKEYLARQKHGEFVVDKSDGAAETYDVLVCAPFTIENGLVFADNRTGVCAECGRAIQWRPYAPTKPKRLCYLCVPDMTKGDKMMITPKTAAELAAFLAKGSKH